jgi:hypothetical protein
MENQKGKIFQKVIKTLTIYHNQEANFQKQNQTPIKINT